MVMFVVGCYHSNGLVPCESRCPDGVTCPAGQACGDDLLCHGDDVISCTFDAPVMHDSTIVDGPPDAPPDSAFACYAVGLAPEFIPVCQDPSTIADSFTFSTTQFITDSDPACADWPQRTSEEPGVCLVIAKTIAVPSGVHVQVRGNRALALIATGKLTVPATSTLDGGSTSLFIGPAFGQGLTPCQMPITGATDTSWPCSGGAAGGSFGATGGGGGISGSNAGALPTPKLATPTFLRGGCAGGNGVVPSSGLSAGDRRKGGGALYLVAGTTIEISGVVTAGGAGGFYASTTSSGGAGGGGSGGMIVLEAPHVVTLGTGGIYANGGGGAGGNGKMVAQFGVPAKDNLGAALATGGTGYAASSPAGGSGGNGSTGGIGQVGTGSAGACGGGGGGSAGVILVYTNDIAPQTVSPTPFVRPLP